MKRIEFKKVGMENFCNYIEPMELKFENGKLVVITGPNGIGKSTIFKAIPFTLYGMTSEGVRGDDVVNNETGKDCHTWIEFEVNEDKYRVDRYHKYKRKGNSVELRKNNELPYKVGQRETLPEIEKLIVPRKLFLNTLLFSQNIKDFFTDLTDTQKKDIFRKVLQLDNYTLYHDETKKRIKDINERVIELNQQLKLNLELLTDSKDQIKVLRSAKKEFEVNKNIEVKKYKTEIADLTSQEIKLKAELDKLKVYIPKIESINNDINSKNQEISDLNTKLLNFKQNANSKKSIKESEIKKDSSESISLIESNYYKSKVEVEKLTKTKQQELHNDTNEEMSKLDIQNNTYSNEITSLEERILEIKENVIDKDISVCPTCYQEIGEKEKEELNQKIINYQKGIEGLIELKKKAINSVDNLKLQYDKNIGLLKVDETTKLKVIEDKEDELIKALKEKLNYELKTLEEKLNEAINESIQYGIRENDRLNTELKTLQNENEKLKEIDNKIRKLENNIPIISSQISMLKENLERKNNEEFDDRQLVSYENKASNLQFEIDRIEIERSKISDNLKILEFWKIGYSQNGMPAMLIDESIPFLNKQVSYYLDKMARGRYVVSFDTMAETKSGEFRDKISVNVIDNHTKANLRSQLSGGQTRLVDIATILTLNDLQCDVQDVSINILLFDEIFDSLDDSNIGYVSNVIRTLTKDRFVSIISHRHIDQIEADEYLNLY